MRTVLNVVTYHAFLNGIDEIRDLVPRQGWRSIEEKIYEMRTRYRAELFAEGASFSYYFGDRMKEKPPYQVGLEHIASLLEKP
ncbi:MAG: hypothetical protein Q8R11_01330 [bacterium]|nr:hypothetical protein [bacterium]